MGDSSLPKLSCGRLAATAIPGGGTFAHACAAGMPPQDKIDNHVSKTLCKCVSPALGDSKLDTLCLKECGSAMPSRQLRNLHFAHCDD